MLMLFDDCLSYLVYTLHYMYTVHETYCKVMDMINKQTFLKNVEKNRNDTKQ